MTRRDLEQEISTPSHDKTPCAPNLAPPEMFDAEFTLQRWAFSIAGANAMQSCIAFLCLMLRVFLGRQLNHRAA
jgi:hypothetical protein